MPPSRLLRGLTLPTWRRVQGGEGVLLAINVSLVLAMRTPLARALGLTLLSAIVLGLMYALNDWWDAARDLDNPRKDHSLARDLLMHRRLFAAWIGAGHLLTLPMALALGGLRALLFTVLVLSVNAAYSFVLKGIPVVDVVTVGLWGGLYAAIVGPLAAVVPVAAMTAASHVFQAMGDSPADLRAGVTTSAASRAGAIAALAVCSIALCATLRPLVGSPLFALGLGPFVVALVVRRSSAAWLVSKAVFAAAWLVVLWNIYGSR